MYKEIVQYYCCYCWCGLILRPFHYLTQKKKILTYSTVEILEKIHIFHVFLRKIKDKKLRKSNQIKKSFNIIVVWLDLWTFLPFNKEN